MTELINLCPWHVSDYYGKASIKQTDRSGKCAKCERNGCEFEITPKEPSR